MRRTPTFRGIAWTVADRHLRSALKSPPLLIPPLIAPLIFYAAFAGGLSGLGEAPGFDYPGGYTSFQFVFVYLQSMLFNGVVAGFGLARDFETGFARRLMLSAPRRDAVLAGYVFAGVLRSQLTAAFLLTVGFATGVRVAGGAAGLLALVALGVAIAFLGSVWGNGGGFRFRSMQGAPLLQIPIFLLLFLSPVFVPRDLLAGWLETTAQGNPFSAFLEAGRDYLAGAPADTVAAIAAFAALAALLTAFAMASLRSAERAPT